MFLGKFIYSKVPFRSFKYILCNSLNLKARTKGRVVKDRSKKLVYPISLSHVKISENVQICKLCLAGCYKCNIWKILQGHNLQIFTFTLILTWDEEIGWTSFFKRSFTTQPFVNTSICNGWFFLIPFVHRPVCILRGDKLL